MKKEVAVAIVEAGQSEGLEVSLHNDYSGRCMYGKKTTGVEFERDSDLLASIALAGAELEPGSVEANDLVEELKDIAQDNMGLGFIVY